MVRNLQIASLTCLSLPGPCSLLFPSLPAPVLHFHFSHTHHLTPLLEMGLGPHTQGAAIWTSTFPVSPDRVLSPSRSPPPASLPRSCFTVKFHLRGKRWHLADGCGQYLQQPGRPPLSRESQGAPYAGAANIASRRKALFFCWACFEKGT